VSQERILITGNEAAGEAAIRAGCRHYFGYPITPQNELTAYMARRLPEVGGVFIQAESELAAINMCFGCAAAGKRVMTSSSSPGISLKQEGISYVAAAELPVVIINVMRGGPGLGDITPSQGDYFQATRGGGHGDYRTLVLAPWSVEEFSYLIALAFDLADYWRNPVLILADGRIGQMMEPCSFPTPPSRQLPEKDWILTGAEGREKRRICTLLLKPGALNRHNDKLLAKYRRITENEVRYEGDGVEDADVVLVAYGTSARLCKEALLMARSDGIRAGLFRPISLWPFPDEPLHKLAQQGKKFLAVEMSGGQMVEDVRLAVEDRRRVGFVGRPGGNAPELAEILSALKEMAEV